MRSGTAACELFDGSHRSESIGAKLVSMLEALGIDGAVTCMTTETAANMKEGVMVDMPGVRWLGCSCHKVELTVQKFVNHPGLKQTLAVFTEVAGHLDKSALSQQGFENAQKVSLFGSMYSPGKSISTLNAGRWANTAWFERSALCAADFSILVDSRNNPPSFPLVASLRLPLSLSPHPDPRNDCYLCRRGSPTRNL